MGLEIISTGAALGAEIRGVDLSRPIDDDTFEEIRKAFYEHEVIYVRGQRISDEDHIRFSARFGGLRRLAFSQYITDRKPEIFVVSNIIENGTHIGSYDAGLFWHTDGSFHANPHAASLLRAIEVPAQDGRTLGDTEFASMTRAYDALPESTKRRLEGLTAVQSVMRRYQKTLDLGRKKENYSEEMKKDPEAVHPVVRLHPVTGKKCIYVNEGYTVRINELPQAEGDALVAELTAHCTRPEFVYRHNWQVGDLVMWDNCSTQHKANFDYALPQRRLMHRTTVISAAA